MDFTKRHWMSRRAARGFTLIELMVVVMIIALLAIIAVPGIMRSSRDRRTFEHANTIAENVKVARSRAIARGSAHMVVFTTNGTTDRGTIRIYEAINVAPGAIADANGVLQPRNPVGSCKGLGQWTLLQVGGAGAPGKPLDGPTSGAGPVADFAETRLLGGTWVGGLNYTTQEPDADHQSLLFHYQPTSAARTAAPSGAVLCFSPNGRTYYADSAALLAGASPTTEVFEMEITALEGAVQRGPKRHILFPASAPPRIRSAQ